MDVFVCYSRRDVLWKDQVVAHLDQMRMAEVLTYASWDDDNIHVGEKWDEAIKAAIANARVALLLVSSDFLTSDYIMNTEVPAFFEKEKQGALVIFPVLIRPCAWEAFDWLAARQHFDKGLVLSGLERHALEEALTRLVEEVGRLVSNEDVSEADGEGGHSAEWTPGDGVGLEAAAVGKETSGDPTAGPFAFLTDAQVREVVQERTGKTPRAVLKVLRTKTQRTWFVAVPGMIVCLLDDARKRASNQLIQWKEPVDALTAVSASRKAGSDWLGHVGVGRRQRWLANLRDFEGDPKVLERALQALKAAARD